MKRNKIGMPLRTLSTVLAAIQFVTTIAPVSMLLTYSSPARAETAPAPPDASSPAPVVTRRAAFQAPRTILPDFSAMPTDQEIFSVQIFPVALLPVGATGPGENRALADALEQYVQRSSLDDQSALLDFLKQHPKSAWKPALLLNLGILWRQTGYFSLALEAWKQSWDLSKGSQEIRARSVADRAIGELAQGYAWIGGYDQLAAIFAEVGDRKLTGGSAEMLAGSRDGLWMMNNRPEGGFMCGPFALQQILAAAEPGAKSSVLAAAKSTKQGTSLAELKGLADQAGMKMQIAKRSANSPFLLNSVIHWKLNHYGSLLKEERGLYLIHDATFSHLYGQDLWISRAALEEESDGYFLVPAGTLPAGWKTVAMEEAKNVWGKGSTAARDDDSGCKSCPPPLMNNGDGNGNGDDADADDSDSDDSDSDSSDDDSYGMAGYRMTLLLAGVYITDTPLRYKPPVGPAVAFKVTYNQRDAFLQAIPNYSNIGAQSSFGWFTYISDNGSNGIRSTVNVYVNEIGQIPCVISNSATGAYLPNRFGDILQYNSGIDSYTLTHADGAREVYGYPSTLGAGARKMYLTAKYDAAGNALKLFYDSYGRLSYVNDALGQTTTLYYDLGSDIYKITRVADPFGRTATFQYDQQDRLQKITDEIGITSAFTYDSGDFVTQLTTPYGVTSFSYGDGGTNGVRWVYVTDPNGDHEYVYSPATGDTDTNAISARDSEVPASVGGASFSGSYLEYRNTFYFTKTALTMGTTNDFTNAIVYHWLHDNDNGGPVLESGILESIRPPLESRIYYWYPGQSSEIYSAGIALRKPSVIARVMDNPTNGGPLLTQSYLYTYNTNGTLAQVMDPLGRQTTYDYYANGIDLQHMRQTTGTANDMLIQFGAYNTAHKPSAYTNAAGMACALTWNSFGQLTNFTNPKNESTIYNYDTNGYLRAIVHSGSGLADTNAYGYDFYGRLSAQTNATGYYLSYGYDNLNRLTNTTYPDGTCEKYVYSKLNLLAMYDRAGNRITYTYDGAGRPITMRDRLNRLTQYSWCGCGSLESITDPMGHGTAWAHDVEGRVTQKTFNDTSTEQYFYAPRSSLLDHVTDARGQMKYYKFNMDDTLAEIDYSNAVLATPSVYLTYDTNYCRLVFMADGTGRSVYTYAPVTGSISVPAGRLVSESNSFTGSTITYNYDELGRTTNCAIDGVNESVTFDALGRITNHLTALGNFGMSYTNVFDLSALRYPNSQVVSFTYLNNAGDQQIAQIANGAGVLSYAYQYDVLGNVKQMTELYTPAYAYTYKYDYENQLLSASAVGIPQPFVTNRASAYGYDLAGNRVSEQVETNGYPILASKYSYNGLNEMTNRSGAGPVPVQFVGTVNEYSTVTVSNVSAQAYPDVDSTNRLFETALNLPTGTSSIPIVATDVNGNAATNNYFVNVAGNVGKVCAYDINGNCTNVSVPGTNTAYEWDAQDRLVAIDAYVTNTAALNRTELLYDGFNRWCQIVQKVNGSVISTKRIVWNNLAPCQERNSANSVTRRFFAEGEQIAGTNYYFVKDIVGSIRQVSDTNNNVVVRYDYDPYGRATRLSGSWNTDADFLYAGYYSHAPSGLNLTTFRAYDADSGRWIRRDPIGEDGGLNLYGYTENNPIIRVDIYGLDDLNLYKPGSQDSQAANVRGSGGSEFTVGGHGNDQAVSDGRGGTQQPMSDQDLANAIKNSKGYDPNKPIRLYNCDAGKGDNSPAQRLSNILPNPIIASTQATRTEGTMDKSGNVTSSKAPYPIDGGSWKTFQGGKAK